MRPFKCPRCGSQTLKREGQLEHAKLDYFTKTTRESERVDLFECQDCQWCGTEEQIQAER